MKTKKNPGVIAFSSGLFSFCLKSGRIVNVGSINGVCAYPGLSVYCATKFGIEGFSDVLRHELAKLGVKVILVRPGGEEGDQFSASNKCSTRILSVSSLDFARLTGIMSRQEVLSSEMWDQMPAKDRMLYNTYFQV